MSDPITTAISASVSAREVQLMKLKDALVAAFKTKKGREIAAKMPKAPLQARPKADELDSRLYLRLSPSYFRALDALDDFYTAHAGRSPSRGLLVRRAIEALVMQAVEATKSGDKAKIDAECAALLRHTGSV